MKQFLYPLLFATLCFSAFSSQAQTDVLHLKSDVVDTIFGNVVADPYRWMENLNSDSLKQWLQEQKKLTKAERKHFNGRMADVLYELKSNSPFSHPSAEKTGAWYFQEMISSDPDASPILYYRKNSDDRFETAFNPNSIEGHRKHTINQWALSDSTGYLAVGVSTEGSDWLEIRVRDLNKEKDLKDRIDWVKFTSIVWWHDGFFYARYKSSGQTDALGGHELYYHKLGESQDDDKLMMLTSTDAHERDFSFQKTSNGRYLVLNKNQKISGIWYDVVIYKDLREGLNSEWKLIAKSPTKDKAFFDVIDYADNGFLFLTNYKAPHGRVLRGSLDSVNHFVEVIPEYEKILKEVNYVHHQLVSIYFTDGTYDVCMFDGSGKKLDHIEFEPGIEVGGFNGAPDDSETIFYESSFYCPRIVQRYNFNTKKYTLAGKTHITFYTDDYTTEIVKYPSKDGTEVAMYLTYKKGLKLKGNNPVILYGYGGFGRSITPFYDPANIAFFKNNGILAVPMIRGGGELGEEWHQNGIGLKKQNSFDDFIAAAQYLIKEGYTSKERLAIEGASNGGLLVSVVITQHPELCQVVIGQSASYDMLRYDRFTGGKYWLNEFGNPDSVADFKNLLSYSPLHNVKPGVAYPATLLITGTNDDRVVPFHTYKFLARLQECSTGNAPHILYLEEGAGHNGASNFTEWNERQSFILSFIFTEMHLPLNFYYHH